MRRGARAWWALLSAGCMLAATPGQRLVRYSDLPPAVRALLARQGINRQRFTQFLTSTEKKTAARLREGESDHLIFFLLQSSRFTARPRIEPALSAREYVQGLSPEERVRYLAGQALPAPAAKIPAAVTDRMKDFLRALDQSGADERFNWFRKSLAPPERTLRHLSAEYARAMRFLYRKEFPGDIPAGAPALGGRNSGGKADPSLYQQRGHSSDTGIESSFAVRAALSVLKSLEPSLRMNRVLLVGPGLDFAPRTALIDSYPPQSYQPWAIADALLALGLASRDRLRIHCVDISDRVLAFFREFPARSEPRLTLLPGWEDPEYVEYFRDLGRQVGTEAPIPGGKSLRLSQEALGWITAAKLNIITERYDPPPPYDLVIVTNVLVYFDNAELLLALSNIHSMLTEGGYLVHNELRPEVEEFSKALDFAPLQARTLRLSRGTVQPLFDSFVIHRKAGRPGRLPSPP